MELWLRRFSSYVYFKRTGDRAGAAHMLAVAAPGGGTDLGPHWLVSESSAYAIAENKIRSTAQSANTAAGAQQWHGEGKGGGGGGKGFTPGAGPKGDARGGGKGGRGRGRGKGK